ncbi:putative GMC oxidoreductase [Podospora fimiseda]|uniref:Long-chain-alcohol oxidase n=1 Tax=Podospora fimiseda TaxID=252190 RepID=A0AAN7GNM3_9PEZI|nr:putative GMC oxidoreductase [Podospora fimiseda]
MSSSPEDASLTAPKPVSLPDPGPDFLSETQWQVLMGIMDTITPALKTKDQKDTTSHDTSIEYLSISQYSKATTQLRQSTSPNEISFDLINAYLSENPSSNPTFSSVLKVVLAQLPPSKKRELRYLLAILSTRPGSLLLTSHSTPFPSLPLSSRTKILHSWRTSSLGSLRALFKSLTTLGKLSFIRSSATFFPLAGFPTTPSDWKPTSSYPYQFLQFPQPIEIDTDVVILGSGCGAGVVTNRLANTFGPSLRVLVLEKGHHFDSSQFPLPQTSGLSQMFESGGVVESDDGSISITAGSCFGGGGTVNWSASLQTQDFVRKDWSETYGLDFFETKKYQECLDYVWEKMGCGDGENLELNHGNKILLEGAEKAGFEKRKRVPQNTGGEKHDCGYCCLGCWKGEKKGPVNGWFPEAVERGDIKFAEGFMAERVAFEMRDGCKVASGVEGVWTPREGGEPVRVKVKAKKVVVSCGTLWSPIVLMNSGLKNPQIGKNLYLHPVNFVAAVFDEDVRPWEGGILTSVVGDFENLDGKGHGAKLEAMAMLPSHVMPFIPWASGKDYKLLAAKYRHLNSYISIVRDRDTGYIYRDATTGGPRVSYTPSEFDRANNLVGVVALAKILFAGGAREIHPCLPGFEPFIRPDGDADKTEKKFKKWLERLKAHGNKPPVTSFVSAHQMGTCRMSLKAKDGVVDPRGRVWGAEGLYVADASVFPTASGVNPMVTAMAIADWIAQGLCEDLKEVDTKPAARL